MEDETLVAALRLHDDQAMMALIETYGTFVRQVVWRNLPSAYERSYTNDIENRTYYKVWTKIGQFDPAKGSFKSWLAAIAQNQARDYQRGLAASFQFLDIDQVYLAEPAAPEPEAQLDTDALFANLSDVERAVFERFFNQDQTPAQIAKALHMRRSAVYQHLSRGRKKLRQGGGLNAYSE
ncbi:sigma-70 family RNA polymerase sigma factor [Lacticaseibacillus kribbianus]|uniref:sigma-70 family RNA polymerase sigma factor n=1 Tax=Lacticaseibacillus kribbianus TaxID=2926292 RepID=UPI001CD20E70|nr:sigma-70 family RNA polymerase sigma factor [Lacticaseibacillus kribbianus]